ncbi:MAG: hypothetical protein WC280_00635 [Patescibacteria group bacterium]
MKKELKKILDESLTLLSDTKIDEDCRLLAEDIILDSYNNNLKRLKNKNVQVVYDFKKTTTFVFNVIKKSSIKW